MYSFTFKPFSLKIGIVSLCIAGLFTAGASSATAQSNALALGNGGFELGNFTGWETFPPQSGLILPTYGGGPTQGSYQALLTTNELTNPYGNAMELAQFLEIELDQLNLNDQEVFEGTAIKTTLNVKAGDTLRFDWNFLTNEYGNDYYDFAFVVISQRIEQLADANSAIYKFNGFDYDNQTTFETFSYLFVQPGTYTLGIGVVNVNDGAGDSAVLVDNVALLSSPDPTTSIPEPTSVLGLLGLGVLKAGEWFLRRR